MLMAHIKKLKILIESQFWKKKKVFKVRIKRIRETERSPIKIKIFFKNKIFRPKNVLKIV